MTQQVQISEKMLDRLLADFAYVEDSQNRPVSGIEMDSRRLRAGDLFLACRGATLHGKRFVQDALLAEVAAIAVDIDEGESLDASLLQQAAERSIPLFAVVNLDQRLGEIAARFYDHPSAHMSVIGVTGTNGKTSCTQFIAQSLHSEATPCGIMGTLGNGIWGSLKKSIFTTPLAIGVQKHLANIRRAGAQAVAMEVSSHGLQQGRVNAVQFDMAVLTNLSHDHLDYHGDMQAYEAAKQRLFDMPGLHTAVINLDDEMGERLLRKLSDSSLQLYGYTLNLAESFDEYPVHVISAQIVQRDRSGMLLKVHAPQGDAQLHASLMGDFNVSNLLAVLCVLLATGLPLEQAIERLQQVTPPAGRMERFSQPGKPLVIVDYAHTPDALAQVLRTLQRHCAGDLGVVFGCGGDRDKGKRPQMARMSESFADRIMVTNDNPRKEDPRQIIDDILQGFSDSSRVQVIPQREAAIKSMIEHAGENDIVLVAGKGHEDYQIIGDQRLPYSDRQVVMDVLGVAA